MNGFKKKASAFLRIVRECFVHSLVPLFMYLAVSGVLLVVIGRKADENGNVAQNTVLTASIICGLIAVAYNAVMAWGCGGAHFEQLVSGNMKRRSAVELGSDLTITGYKAHKEYRPWKGFVIGLFVAWPVLAAGLLFGNYQQEILAGATPKVAGAFIVIFTFLGGWATIPFRYMNAANWGVSAVLALIPVIVTGAFYIIGAYSRRAGVAKKQALADRKSAEQTQKPKKINYGGLPGTKPNKKK